MTLVTLFGHISEVQCTKFQIFWKTSITRNGIWLRTPRGSLNPFVLHGYLHTDIRAKNNILEKETNYTTSQGIIKIELWSNNCELLFLADRKRQERCPCDQEKDYLSTVQLFPKIDFAPHIYAKKVMKKKSLLFAKYGGYNTNTQGGEEFWPYMCNIVYYRIKYTTIYLRKYSWNMLCMPLMGTELILSPLQWKHARGEP